MKKLLSILLVATCAFATAYAAPKEEGRKEVSCGETVHLEATPKTYFKFVNWTDQDNTELGITPTLDYTLSSETEGDVTITANFERLKYTVTYELDNNAENHGVTLATGMDHEVLNQDAGLPYTIDVNHFTLPGDASTKCISIVGYKVTIASSLEVDGSTVSTVENKVIEITDLSQLQFVLTGDAVVTPVVERTKRTIILMTNDENMGSARFVPENQ